MRTFLPWFAAVVLAGVGPAQPLPAPAAQMFDVTLEITIDDWGYRFLDDKNNLLEREQPPRPLRQTPLVRHCVVGPDTWQMESELMDVRSTFWFSGTNLVREMVNTNDTGGGQSFPAVTRRSLKEVASVDGNPETPGLLSYLDVPGKIAWLAVCSGPCFKHADHKLFPPGPFWVESSAYKGNWTEQAMPFPDRLGLPQNVTLLDTNQRVLFAYQVHSTTNCGGWDFPLEFYGVQYHGAGGQLELTYEGRITAIHPATAWQIPTTSREPATSARAGSP
jgi:hypothetical protein